ncbi:baseplate J/gp47 family protein [Methylovirgula sp. 4M-Z18]|uniref:baseplate J/gp47 family protein n=1 Tax=Methylovirgula sp. 4M-Z18 TaxID=2293567 RepID=UPI000E2F0F0A|nr:baseplate J/gp47 family protein [Methylovirgula sp. 4M-Z18]RFB80401.1 hypothetical protein DYH55_02415 [Methylovirgula sp. 4M-Z18]
MTRFPFAALDLSLLPAPQVLPVDYEQIRADRLADFQARWATARQGTDLPTYDVALSEADPAVLLQEEDSYREMLDTQSINDATLAVMWAFAQKSDLDQLAVLVGLRRLTLVAADPTTTPPTAAVTESDADFRARGRLALDATAIGLTGGGYITIVKQVAPEVRAVGLIKRGGGQIDVILLGRGPDGSVTDDVVARVSAALLADEGSQLTDIVSVRSATPVPYDVVINATIPPGPSAGTVQTQSTTNLAVVAAALQVIGGVVPTDALIAAGRVPPMTKLTLVSPPVDIAVAADAAPYARTITVNVQPVVS